MYTEIKSAPETPVRFWNFKTSVPTVRRLHTAVTKHSDICSAGQRSAALWQWHCLIQTHIMFLTAIICYCGYPNGVKKDQWRRANHTEAYDLLLHLAAWDVRDTLCSDCSSALEDTCRAHLQCRIKMNSDGHGIYLLVLTTF